MKRPRVVRALVLLLGAAGLGGTGCTDSCLRHTDCYDDEACVLGACRFVAKREPADASTVDTMTPDGARPRDATRPPLTPEAARPPDAAPRDAAPEARAPADSGD